LSDHQWFSALTNKREAIMEDRNRDAFGVREFCRRHDVSTGYLYSEWRRGRGPRYMQLGDRRIISVEAASDWRREREAETTLQLAE
jgi:hypothetical protein